MLFNWCNGRLVDAKGALGVFASHFCARVSGARAIWVSSLRFCFFVGYSGGGIANEMVLIRRSVLVRRNYDPNCNAWSLLLVQGRHFFGIAVYVEAV